MRTLMIFWVDAKDFPPLPTKGWESREIPYWCLGLDPGNLTQKCYVKADGSVFHIVVSK
jgi:hypothetical protein